jgi:hypothetical protein
MDIQTIIALVVFAGLLALIIGKGTDVPRY